MTIKYVATVGTVDTVASRMVVKIKFVAVPYYTVVRKEIVNDVKMKNLDVVFVQSLTLVSAGQICGSW